jgi:hypothetical protein
MGSDCRATIAFGIDLGDSEQPWTNDELEDWWLKVNNYEPPYEIYDDEGYLIDGIDRKSEKCKAYWEHRNNWIKEHPCPVALAYYGTDFENKVLMIPSTEISSYYLEVFGPKATQVNQDEIESFKQFVNTYVNKEDLGDLEPEWLLMVSYA